ncbi:MAG: hypothetical protein QXP70_05700 [Methanomassiliicoccales archaeon]
MKAEAGRIKFGQGFRFRQLKQIFPTLYTTFLQETDQMPEQSEMLDMLLELNMRDIRENRKPPGYNRKGRMRMLFPIGRNEMLLLGNSTSAEVVRVTERMSKLLQKAGIKHTVEWQNSDGIS